MTEQDFRAAFPGWRLAPRGWGAWVASLPVADEWIEVETYTLDLLAAACAALAPVAAAHGAGTQGTCGLPRET